MAAGVCKSDRYRANKTRAVLVLSRAACHTGTHVGGCQLGLECDVRQLLPSSPNHQVRH
jgi:hypothetical protein